MSQQSVEFRGYLPGDLDALFALDRICFKAPFRFSKKAMRRFAEAPEAVATVAEIGGAVVGFCILSFEGEDAERFAYVITLDVHPELRRQGIAHTLMQHAEKASRDESCQAIYLHVYTENAAAVRFYEREAFSRKATKKHFYGAGLDAYVYRKPLG